MKNEKTIWEKAEIRVIPFSESDILTTSAGIDNGNGEIELPPVPRQ